MNKIILSICIPTYNFGKFISQTIDSITPNLTDNTEVIILDGGSTDNTPEIIKEKQLHFPQIKYYRQDFRGGIDRDIEKVISLANGYYCWLFSADDIMIDGAIDKLLKEFSSDQEIYLCEQILCDYNMNYIKEYPIFLNITKPEIFNLEDKTQRQRYFSQAVTSEAFFSFLSSPIFRKDIWEKAGGIQKSFYGTCWGLAGCLLSLIPKGLTIYYLNEKLLYKRTGNDSFSDQGLVRRLQIAVEGFSHIAEVIFGAKSEEAFHIRRVVRNEWTLRVILAIKLRTFTTPQTEDIIILNRVVKKHYSDFSIKNKCKYTIFKLTPVSLIKQLKCIKTYFKKPLQLYSTKLSKKP